MMSFYGLSGFVGAAVLLSTAVVRAQVTVSGPAANVPITVTIRRPAAPMTIPKTVFGSFLEPIGHSTYGGLWADVVENGSFENGLWSAGNVVKMVTQRPELRRGSELGLPLPWQPLDGTQGARYLPVRGDAANSEQSVLIMSLPGKEVGVLERVYLPVHRELAYNGAVWVKHVRGNDQVLVSLRRHDHPEQVLAKAMLTAGAATWTKLPFTLTLQANQVSRLEPVDLVISLMDDARAEVDNVSLSPADAVEGMDPEMVRMARELHSPVVRFGGNFTSAYDWRDGVGPMDKRVSKLNISWGIPEYNTFGTDEFLRFCRLIDTEPQVALNLGTGTPEQAAEWVEYIDTHWPQHSGLLWELGNELWGDFQVGYPSLGRVSAVTTATSEAVRKADPAARLIATGGDEDQFRDWNAAQLSAPGNTFNYLSTHFVVGDTVELRNPPADFRTMAALALPVGLEVKLKEMHEQILQSAHKDVKTAFTEWLMISDTRTGPHYTNMGGALFAAGFLNMVMRNSDIVPISDMTGIIEFAGIWQKRGQVYGAPSYWVLREYASAAPTTLLAVESTSPTYTVAKGIRRLPEIGAVPYLDVTAAMSGDGRHLLLFCVNRHLTDTLTAEFNLVGLGVAKGGTVKVSTLRGDGILSENDEEDPNAVVPAHSTEAMGGRYTHRFPNGSVTVLDLPVGR